MPIALTLAAVFTTAGGTWSSTPWLARIIEAPEPAWLLVWGVALLALTSALRHNRTASEPVTQGSKRRTLPVGWSRTVEGLEG
jgi:hypothetical protein